MKYDYILNYKDYIFLIKTKNWIQIFGDVITFMAINWLVSLFFNSIKE